MNDLSGRVASGVQIMSLDYALRSAIGTRDRGTIVSVLRNHGSRVGAARMQLIGLDGRVQIDSTTSAGDGQPFAFPDLVSGAYDGHAAAVVVMNGKAFWVVVVPVYAPQPVGLVAASIPLDDALVAHMQRLSALPRDVELVSRDGAHGYRVIAHGDSLPELTASFAERGEGLPGAPTLTHMNGREYIALAQPLKQPRGSGDVLAVMGYSLDDAMRPYKAIWSAWLGLLALGLAGGLVAS